MVVGVGVGVLVRLLECVSEVVEAWWGLWDG